MQALCQVLHRFGEACVHKNSAIKGLPAFGACMVVVHA